MRKLHNKFLITKDQHEDKAAHDVKMQASPYYEEEYWQIKKYQVKRTSPDLKRIDKTLLELIKKLESDRES